MIPVCLAPSDQATEMALFTLESQRGKIQDAIIIVDAQVNGSRKNQDNIKKNVTITFSQTNATAFLPTAPTTTVQAICTGSRPSTAIKFKMRQSQQIANRNRLRASTTTQKCHRHQHRKESAELNKATIGSFLLSSANTKYSLSEDIRQYFNNGRLSRTHNN
jgi:hypothetical protein